MNQRMPVSHNGKWRPGQNATFFQPQFIHQAWSEVNHSLQRIFKNMSQIKTVEYFQTSEKNKNIYDAVSFHLSIIGDTLVKLERDFGTAFRSRYPDVNWVKIFDMSHEI